MLANEALKHASVGLKILGPNCYGFINALDNVALWPDQHGCKPVKKGVAILTQSSNMAINLTMQNRGLPISYVIACGNQLQLDQAQIALYLLNDKRELIQGIETRQKVKIKVVPDNTIEGANYHIDRDNRTSDEFKASLNKQNDKNTKTLNETSSRYEEAIVSAVTPKSLPPKPIMSKKKIKKRK